ncbi:unnamed protein product [Schistocephalus solidus]|uniref:Reverse transcriptase domain-containing protein n=1 Tax=Schistocephalus solidus TaxID=70667 RepID=A0A183TT38_SCHSO|nr:unnamed protein product [Schistocephalus solidus]
MVTVHSLLFVDGCALNILPEEDMQRCMELFASGCAKHGLTNNTDKMSFIHQPSPGTAYNGFGTAINSNQL